MGCGKTYISCYIAKTYKLDLIVVCPLNVLDKWKKVANEFNLQIQTFTYQKLAGRKTKKEIKHISHDLLTFTNKYKPTETLINMRNKLLVFDEFHNIIHDTAQTRASMKIIQTITKNCENSKVALLSATPFTKEQDIKWFINNVPITYKKSSINQKLNIKQIATNIMTDEIADSKNIGSIYSFLINRFISVNEVTTFNILSSKVNFDSFGLSNLSISDKIYDIKTNIGYSEDISRILFNLTMLGITLKEDHNHIDLLILMKQINMYMHCLEIYKLDYILNDIKEDIKNKSEYKYVIFMNYKDTITELKTKLMTQKINTITITGEDDSFSRTKKINMFQNDFSMKSIICNTKAAATGIDLDDKVGNIPRKVYIFPSFDYCNVIQAIGRVYRIDTKSMPEINFIYLMANGKSECKLLRNIQTKLNFTSSINKSLFYESRQIHIDV